jgi:tetratricopeptide (TPR) repeat protein
MQHSMNRGRNWLAIAGIAIALAGCDTVSGGGRGAGIAELDTGEASAAKASVNIGSLSEVVNRNPNDPQAYNTRGAAYARIGRYSDAISDFAKAVQIDPNNAAALTNRGLALRQSGRNDAALADFNRATTVNPNYAPRLYRPRQSAARPEQQPAGARRSQRGDPPQPGIGRGLPCPRTGLPEGRPAPARCHRFRFGHRPQSLHCPALYRPRPEPERAGALRFGAGGLHGGAQRRQPQRRCLGRSRLRQREAGQAQRGGRELPARPQPRWQQRRCARRPGPPRRWRRRWAVPQLIASFAPALPNLSYLTSRLSCPVTAPAATSARKRLISGTEPCSGRFSWLPSGKRMKRFGGFASA